MQQKTTDNMDEIAFEIKGDVFDDESEAVYERMAREACQLVLDAGGRLHSEPHFTVEEVEDRSLAFDAFVPNAEEFDSQTQDNLFIDYEGRREQSESDALTDAIESLEGEKAGPNDYEEIDCFGNIAPLEGFDRIAVFYHR